MSGGSGSLKKYRSLRDVPFTCEAKCAWFFDEFGEGSNAFGGSQEFWEGKFMVIVL